MPQDRENGVNLNGAKILITGGAGLVGSHIADLLVQEGARVLVYDNFVRGKAEHLDWAQKHGDVRVIQGDIRDRELLQQSMKDVDYVFHQAAAWLRLCQNDPRLSLEINIAGTFNVLEACVTAGVKKIVAASSSSVYGEGLYLPTDEDHPFNNDLFYGASKVCNEQHYGAFHKKYGLPFVAFRYLNVYGPRQPFAGAYTDAIMHFINRIEQDQPPVVRGDGSATLDLVYVADVARANWMALKSPITHDFFNVASGVETSVNDLAKKLIRLCGKEGRLAPVHEPMDQGLVTRRWGSPEKARKLLGFAAETSVEEGLMRVIQWRREQARGAVPA